MLSSLLPYLQRLSTCQLLLCMGSTGEIQQVLFGQLAKIFNLRRPVVTRDTRCTERRSTITGLIMTCEPTLHSPTALYT